MGFFNKDEVVRNVPPLRSLHYKPVPIGTQGIDGKEQVIYSRPYVVKVGTVFPVKNSQGLEVTDILFADEVFTHAKKVMYDVYVKKEGDNISFIWKTLPHSDNLQVEYLIDF